MPKTVISPTTGGNREKIVATPEDLVLIEEEAANGVTRKGIARKLGIANSTLDLWMNRDPEVRAAWERGMALDEEVYISRLRRSILDPNDRFGGPSAMFMLKCKHKWNERSVVEAEEPDDEVTRTGSLFSPEIEIVQTHRDPNTGVTLQEPTVTEAPKGQ